MSEPVTAEQTSHLAKYATCCADGLSQGETARELGVSTSAVTHMAKTHGLKFKRGRQGPKVGSKYGKRKQILPTTGPDPLREKIALLFADDRERTMQDVIHALAARGCKKPEAIADAMFWMRKKELLAADRHIDTGKLIWRRAAQ